MPAPSGARIIRRYYLEMWNRWIFALADRLLSPDIRFRGSLGVDVRGIEAFRGYMRHVQCAFPDFSNTIEEVVAQETKIVARLTYRGTHRGELFGIPPTGKRIAYSGAAFFRISRGKIAEGWVLGDTTALIRQLDAPPSSPPREAAQSRFRIVAANAEQRDWAAALMASSEPWTTLRRDLPSCRAACHRPDSLLFIAFLDAEPCGFVILQRRGVADSPYIKSIAVVESHRGRGVGSRLIRFAEDFFRLSASHIFICASSFNPRARALYERLGYSYVAELKDFVILGASEILLHKSLLSTAQGNTSAP